ncbi:MAG: tRNA (adenosine(37)-N6)-threonylcarbamoyltransferase complex dimerization subunit type 1 TsaB [Oscillospiraceae bacterium]|nr:tRNA (adenosine(37)-N6)-threonylcarbamoyltransferase complex dimerization subunit type 1 TsaB [Oscillospiraceae bacterium]
MILLAMDSSAKSASVAICDGETLLGQYFQNNGLTHSRTLLAMTENLLRNLELPISGIDLFAVSSGPGSFTGVRIGVSTVKGLAWGADKPACGVSTLEAMAHQMPEHGIIICPVMDARRSQVYNALFKWKGDSLYRLCEDRAVSLDDLAAELKGCDSQICLIGDGASISHEHLTAAGVPCRLAPALLRCQTAYGVALAALRSEQIPAVDLEPSYLRPSQAERERRASEA